MGDGKKDAYEREEEEAAERARVRHAERLERIKKHDPQALSELFDQINDAVFKLKLDDIPLTKYQRGWAELLQNAVKDLP